MKITNAVIPVAGLGTRLLPATKSQPKEMLPVGKRPVVQYIVEELEHNSIERILFITGPNKDSIENHFDYDPILIRYLRETGKEDLLDELEFERANLSFFYTRQKSQRGLGDAILHAAEFSGSHPFAVALGDSILGCHKPSSALTQMSDLFFENNCAAVVAFENVPRHDVHRYGIAEPAPRSDLNDDVFEVRDLIEKPEPNEAPSTLAVAARYIFSERIFPALRDTKPGKGGEIQLTDAIRLLLRNGEKVIGLKLSDAEPRYDIGNFESYFKAFVDFALNDPTYGTTLRDYTRQLLNNSDDNATN